MKSNSFFRKARFGVFKTILIILNAVSFNKKILVKQKLALGLLILGLTGITHSCGKHYPRTCYKPAMIEPPQQTTDTLKNDG